MRELSFNAFTVIAQVAEPATEMTAEKKLTFNIDTIRVFLHLIGVAVWVGGQIVVGFLIPVLRKAGPETTQKVARRFNRIAWPFLGLIVFTGIWGLAENSDEYTGSGWFGLFSKLVLVTLSGVAAWQHVNTTSNMLRRIYAMGSLGFALVAMLFGMALAT